MSNHANPITATDQQIIDAVERTGGIRPAARALGLARSTISDRLQLIRRNGVRPSGQGWSITDSPPTTEEPIEGLWERRREEGRRVKLRVAHGEIHSVAVHQAGPVGILHIGDPHLDDPGCDFEALADDIELVRETPGLFAGIIGDMRNNWVGRLAKLHARSDVTAADSWRLAEEVIRRLGGKLIYLTDGNHDLWSGDSDPLKWIMRYHAPGIHTPHGVRIRFTFPAGDDVRLAARHEWPGSSQYNPAFGAGKAAYQGRGDHLIVSGHKHASGYFQYLNGYNGVLSHCIQIGSYKVMDDYAEERGLQRNNLSPSVLTVIDPGASSETERVQVFTSARAGVIYLKALRAALPSRSG